MLLYKDVDENVAFCGWVALILFFLHQSEKYQVVITIIFRPHHYSYHLFDDTATNNLV